MRVVVVGATGNVGTSVLSSLVEEAEVDSILGVARRRPSLELPKVEWPAADVRSADLTKLFAGADAVIHLAWAIQPSRDESETESVNVVGSERVFGAVADAGVPRLIYASSVGAYSPGPKDRLVDESHPTNGGGTSFFSPPPVGAYPPGPKDRLVDESPPTNGVAPSFYSRHKAAVERILDRFESATPSVSVVRLRPALIFKGDAASEIRRLF